MVSRPHDRAVSNDVDEVGFDMIQQALVMRHKYHCVYGVGERAYAVGHDAERIDVEPRISFIENADFRFQDQHL